MKLKTVTIDGKTYAEVQDDKPIYVGDDGTETPMDVAGTKATIARLNSEAKAHREAKEAAEKALKAFDGIEDPVAAIKAMGIAANLDAKKLIDAGEVEKANAQRDKGWQDKLTAAEKRAQDAVAAYEDKVIGEAFMGSKFLTEKTILTPRLARSEFAKQIKIEDGKPVAYGFDGQKIYSAARPGELANTEEAIEALVGSHPDRDHLLKGNGNGGAGTRNGTGAQQAKEIKREAFDALPQLQRAQALKDGVKLID